MFFMIFCQFVCSLFGQHPYSVELIMLTAIQSQLLALRRNAHRDHLACQPIEDISYNKGIPEHQDNRHQMIEETMQMRNLCCLINKDTCQDCSYDSS